MKNIKKHMESEICKKDLKEVKKEYHNTKANRKRKKEKKTIKITIVQDKKERQRLN